MLIEIGDRRILVDSGIGNGRFTDKQRRNYGIREESFIKADLAKNGLSPDDIDYILMTHLHFDHASGLAEGEAGAERSVFKNAKIYASAVEWEEMKNPNIRSRNTYWEQNWKPVKEQVTTFTGRVEVIPGVTLIHTGGHSDGHSIIVIEHEGETLIHLADLMPTHAHQNVLWVLAYDDYPLDSIAAKQKWQAFAAERDAWYLFYHDYKYRALKWGTDGKVVSAVERERRLYE